MKKYWLFGSIILVIIASACGTSTLAPSEAPPDLQAPAETVPAAELPVVTEPATEPPAATVPPAEPTAEQVVLAEIATPASAVSINAEALLQERCTRCHNLNRITNQSESLEEWTMIVEEMIQKGATLTDEEKLVLIEYLSATYPD